MFYKWGVKSWVTVKRNIGQNLNLVTPCVIWWKTAALGSNLSSIASEKVCLLSQLIQMMILTTRLPQFDQYLHTLQIWYTNGVPVKMSPRKNFQLSINFPFQSNHQDLLMEKSELFVIIISIDLPHIVLLMKCLQIFFLGHHCQLVRLPPQLVTISHTRSCLASAFSNLSYYTDIDITVTRLNITRPGRARGNKDTNIKYSANKAYYFSTSMIKLSGSWSKSYGFYYNCIWNS